MKPPTATYFFMGANSESGFYSLYDQFCSDREDTLHIIKGGPGTGKSTFMKRIGKAAEERNLDVEYILCSGDPDSLDGVYIPALHMGWADGTSPHILEPHHFGTSAIYDDLGRFCHVNCLLECRDLITALTDAYRSSYQIAYHYLNAAASVRKASDVNLPHKTEDKIRKRAHSKIKRELSSTHHGKAVKRFIQGISHMGVVVTSTTLNSLCDRLCVLESNFNLEQIFFDEIYRELLSEQADFILCPDPLCPNQINAIIMPTERLCFLSSNTAADFHGTIRTIHLDSYLPKEDKLNLTTQKHLYEQLLSAAITHLRNAKHLHDDLEQCYRPSLDTSALNEYTEAVIHKIF